jgi:hypothetical protein
VPPQTPSWGEIPPNDSQDKVLSGTQNKVLSGTQDKVAGIQDDKNGLQKFLDKAQSGKQLVLILFCSDKDKKEVTFLKTVQIDVIPEIPETPTKEEQDKLKEDTKKAQEDAKKNNKKFVPPPPPTAKTNPPVVSVGENKRFLTDFVYVFVTVSKISDCQLALNYKITELPQIVFCDCYGNELGRQLLNTKQLGSTVVKARTEMLKKQMELEASLNKQLQQVEKSFNKEKEQQAFTPATIKQLKTLADYKAEKSYESVLKARAYLKEINDLTENKKKLSSKILAPADQVQ